MELRHVTTVLPAGFGNLVYMAKLCAGIGADETDRVIHLQQIAHRRRRRSGNVTNDAFFDLHKAWAGNGRVPDTPNKAGGGVISRQNIHIKSFQRTIILVSIKGTAATGFRQFNPEHNHTTLQG
jgi:hypothetical protein